MFVLSYTMMISIYFQWLESSDSASDSAPFSHSLDSCIKLHLHLGYVRFFWICVCRSTRRAYDDLAPFIGVPALALALLLSVLIMLSFGFSALTITDFFCPSSILSKTSSFCSRVKVFLDLCGCTTTCWRSQRVLGRHGKRCYKVLCLERDAFINGV